MCGVFFISRGDNFHPFYKVTAPCRGQRSAKAHTVVMRCCQGFAFRRLKPFFAELILLTSKKQRSIGL